jgi:hypothetical protein
VKGDQAEWPENCVGSSWAVHSSSKQLVKCHHNFPPSKDCIPSLVLFGRGVQGFKAAQNDVAKHFKMLSDDAVTAGTAVPVFEPPVYVTLATYDEWVKLQAAVAKNGVPVMEPIVLTCQQATADEDGEDITGNVWVFAHVADATRSSILGVYAGDEASVVGSMQRLMVGLPSGSGFVCPYGTNYKLNGGIALSALVIARYSRFRNTVWDLCNTRLLQALPMAVIGLGRNYVCVGGSRAQVQGPSQYDTMVDTMHTTCFLSKTCEDYFDGDWSTNSGAHYKLTVMLTTQLHATYIPNHQPTNPPPNNTPTRVCPHTDAVCLGGGGADSGGRC